VWLRAIRPQRSGYHVMIAIAIALPMFYLAFIENMSIWAAPAVVVVLLAKIVTRPPLANSVQATEEIQK
jgi:hypothetical protein